MHARVELTASSPGYTKILAPALASIGGPLPAEVPSSRNRKARPRDLKKFTYTLLYQTFDMASHNLVKESITLICTATLLHGRGLNARQQQPACEQLRAGEASFKTKIKLNDLEFECLFSNIVITNNLIVDF